MEKKVREMRRRLRGIVDRLSDGRAKQSSLREARNELADLSGEALALAEETDEPETTELIAEVLFHQAFQDYGYSQDGFWFDLHPQLQQVARIGEASGRSRGLEFAAWAHETIGGCLIEFDHPQGAPNDRGWGARELHEAIRLGRASRTPEGLLHAARAGLRLARALREEGNDQVSAAVCEGICRTRDLARDALDGETLKAFESSLADELGEAPEAWCTGQERRLPPR